MRIRQASLVAALGMRRTFTRVVLVLVALVLLGPFQDASRAVPSPDRDKDLIVDSQDGCPDVFNPREGSANLVCGKDSPYNMMTAWAHWSVDQFGYPIAALGLCFDQTLDLGIPGIPFVRTHPCMFEGVGPGRGTVVANSYVGHINFDQPHSSTPQSFTFAFSRYEGTPPEGCSPPATRTVTVTASRDQRFVPFFWVFTCPDADSDKVRDGLDLCPGKADPPGITSACSGSNPKPITKYPAVPEPIKLVCPPPGVVRAGACLSPIEGGPSLIEKVCGSEHTEFLLGTGSAATGLSSILTTAQDIVINPATGYATMGPASAVTKAGAYGGLALGAAGLGCTVVAPPNPGSSAWAEAACGGLSSASMTLGVGAIAGSWTVLGGLALGAASLGTGLVGWGACLSDPPDPKFRTVEKPVANVFRVASMKGVSRKQAVVLEAMGKNALDAHSVVRAMTLCINRASGAAQAKNKLWERRQRACAATYARRLAGLYRAQVPIRHALVRMMRNAGIADVTVSRQLVVALLQNIPLQAEQRLKKVGFTTAQLRFADNVASYLPLAGKLPTGVFDAINGSKTLRAVNAGAKAFDQIAKKYG